MVAPTAKRKPKPKAKPAADVAEDSSSSSSSAEVVQVFVTQAQLTKIRKIKTAIAKGISLADDDIDIDVDHDVDYVTETMMSKAEAARTAAEAEARGEDPVEKIPRAPKVKKITPREATGLQFADKEGTYDVPILDTRRWYRLQVRKASENTIAKAIDAKGQTAKWRGKILRAFVPQQVGVKMKGEGLAIAPKPMIPGMVYVEAVMGPEVADAIESIRGIFGLSKNKNGLVVPIMAAEAAKVEAGWQSQAVDLKEEFKLFKKDGYLSIVSGPHNGTYGILYGVVSGKLEVCLRGESKDEFVLIDAADCRYLENPPEKKWQEMSAKEAVESLLQKNTDGKNPTLNALKKAGLLNQILYGRDGADQPEYKRRLDAQGFEERDTSAKRERSIAKPEAARAAPKVREWSPQREGVADPPAAPIAAASSAPPPVREWTPKKIYQKPPGGPSDYENVDDRASLDSDLRAMASYGSSFDASRAGGRESGERTMAEKLGAGMGVGMGAGAKTGSLPSSDRDEDFDAFIQGLLDDLDEDPKAAAPAGKAGGAGARPSAFASSDIDLDWLESDSSSGFGDLGGARGGMGSAGGGGVESSSSTGTEDFSDSDAILESLLRDLAEDKAKSEPKVPAAKAPAAKKTPSNAVKSADVAVSRGETGTAGTSSAGSDVSAEAGMGDAFDDFGDDFADDLGDDFAPTTGSAAPKMTDFGSFEQYLSALVMHEKMVAGEDGSGRSPTIIKGPEARAPLKTLRQLSGTPAPASTIASPPAKRTTR